MSGRRSPKVTTFRVEIDLSPILRNAATIVDLVRIALGMHSSATPGVLPQGQQQQPPSDPVAGRIEAAVTDLTEATNAWLSYMQARGKKQRTIDAFRQILDRASRDRGWSKIGDLTFDAVTGWLASQKWKGTTYNRNLSVFRSLTKYLTASGRMASDPLVVAERAEDDGGDGARAATVEEARKVILRAWVRDQNDRRCKGNRALYWLCLFAAGCRLDEPARWQRRHLILDHEHPHVLWTHEIQKNHKRQDVALCPELVAQLRAHLAAVDRDRAERGLTPAGPNDPVFPTVPSKGTFAADRDAVQIPAKDYRGRSFSPHSARKFFSTALTSEGVSEKMVDRLMRHTGRVEHRYYDPSLHEQAAAAAKLPRLWPVQGGGGVSYPQNPKIGDPCLTVGPRNAEDGVSTPASRTQPSTSPPGSAARLPEWNLASSAGPVGEFDCLMRAAGQGRPEQKAGAIEPAELRSLKSAFQDSKFGGTPNDDLADLLEALARLLRTRSGQDGRSSP